MALSHLDLRLAATQRKLERGFASRAGAVQPVFAQEIQRQAPLDFSAGNREFPRDRIGLVQFHHDHARKVRQEEFDRLRARGVQVVGVVGERIVDKRRHGHDVHASRPQLLDRALGQADDGAGVGFHVLRQLDRPVAQPQTLRGLADDQAGVRPGRVGLGKARVGRARRGLLVLLLPQQDQEIGLEQFSQPDALARSLGGGECLQFLLANDFLDMLAFQEHDALLLAQFQLQQRGKFLNAGRPRGNDSDAGFGVALAAGQLHKATGNRQHSPHGKRKRAERKMVEKKMD